MDVFVTLLFMLAVLCGIGAVIYWAHKVEKQRMEEIQTLANKLNFTYQGSRHNYARSKRRTLFGTGRDANKVAVSALGSAAQQLQLFNIGTTANLRNLIQGQMNGINVSIADYTYTTGTNDNKRSRTQTIVLLESEKQQFPKFVLTPENVLHRIGSKLGLQDIDFSTHPHFSRCYHMTAKDEFSVRALFTPKVLTFIEQTEDKVTVEGNQGVLLYYTQHESLEPREWSALIHRARRLFQQFQVS